MDATVLPAALCLVQDAVLSSTENRVFALFVQVAVEASICNVVAASVQ